MAASAASCLVVARESEMEVNLKPGWLKADTRRAAIRVARDKLAEAERRVRQLNDELSDACTAVKIANQNLLIAKRR